MSSEQSPSESHNSESEFSVGEFKLRQGWRLRLWFLVDRVRTWRRLRKWTPEMREELKRVGQAIDREIDREMFFGPPRAYHPSECGHEQSPPTDAEIARCSETVIVRLCPVCGRELWWNVDQWRKV